jgi:hypothetical protein
VGIEEQYLDQRGRAAERKYERQVAASPKRKAKSLAALKAKKRRGIEFLMASAGVSGEQGRVPGSASESDECNAVCGTPLTGLENGSGYCYRLCNVQLQDLSRTSRQSRLRMEARDGGKWRLLGPLVALVTLKRTGEKAGAKYMFEPRYAKRRLQAFTKHVNKTLDGAVAWWRFEASHDDATSGREAFIHAHAIVPLEAVEQLNHAAASDVGLTINVESMPLPAAVNYLSKAQIDPAIPEATTYAKQWKGLPLSRWTKTANTTYKAVEQQLPEPEVWQSDYLKLEKGVKRDNKVWAALNAIKDYLKRRKLSTEPVERRYWIETDNEICWRVLEIKAEMGLLETPNTNEFIARILEWRNRAIANHKPKAKTGIKSHPPVRGSWFMKSVHGAAEQVVKQALKDSVSWSRLARHFGGFWASLEPL